MCGEDGAQREVYKLKEEPKKGIGKKEKKRRRTEKQRETRGKKVRRKGGITD